MECWEHNFDIWNHLCNKKIGGGVSRGLGGGGGYGRDGGGGSAFQ